MDEHVTEAVEWAHRYIITACFIQDARCISYKQAEDLLAYHYGHKLCHAIVAEAKLYAAA